MSAAEALFDTRSEEVQDQHVEQDDQVATVEFEMHQRLELAVRDDRQDAERGQADATHLPKADAVAEQERAGRDDQHRHQRVQY